MTTNLQNIQNQLDQLNGLVQRKFVVYNIDGPFNSYDKLYQIPGSNGFLHYIEYSPSKLNETKAHNYFKQFSQNIQAPFCSACFKSGKVFRNFDFQYDDNAQFIVKMNKDENKGVLYNSIGMACTDSHLSRQNVSNVLNYNAYNEYFDILPYTMVDGINEAGVYAQTNAVNSNGMSTIDINPDKTEECALQTMIIRKILDKCGNVDQVEDILDEMHIYGTSYIKNFYVHVLVASVARYYVIEFEDDHYEINQFPIMTNFRTNRGFQVTNKSKRNFMPKWETIENGGSGVERWETICNFLSSGQDLSALRDQLRYTNLYTMINEDETHDAWLTDLGLTGELSLSCAKDCHENKLSSEYYDDFQTMLSANQVKYLTKDRNKKTDYIVQTVHGAIYDIRNLSAELEIQEGTESQGNMFRFRLDV